MTFTTDQERLLDQIIEEVYETNAGVVTLEEVEAAVKRYSDSSFTLYRKLEDDKKLKNMVSCLIFRNIEKQVK